MEITGKKKLKWHPQRKEQFSRWIFSEEIGIFVKAFRLQMDLLKQKAFGRLRKVAN